MNEPSVGEGGSCSERAMMASLIIAIISINLGKPRAKDHHCAVLGIPTSPLVLTGALFLAADAPKVWSWGMDGPTATLIAAFIAVVPTLLVEIATLIVSARIAGV